MGKRHFLYFFDTKKMRWNVVVMCVLMMLTACGMTDLGETEHMHSDGIWVGAGVSDPEIVCYVTAFDYCDGYDWKSDPEKGKVKCTLVLFAGTKPVMKIPVSDASEMSSDPQRHRVIGGNLYSDFSDGETTVVKKNGREIYRYEGAENVEKMLLHKGRIHTLCRPVRGSGFTYRIDGQLVIKRESGSFYEHISVYRDTVSFFFNQSIISAEGVAEGHYQVRAGTVEKLDIGKPLKVWDIRRHEDDICMIVSPAVEDAPVMICGEDRNTVDYFRGMTILHCRFVDSERICASLRCHHVGSNLMTDFYWMADGDWDAYRFTQTFSCFHADLYRTYAVINPEENRDGLIFYGRRANLMPQGYHALNRRCMTVIDGTMYVGLTSDKGGKPVLWTTEALDTLNVNGYIASVSGYR